MAEKDLTWDLSLSFDLPSQQSPPRVEDNCHVIQRCREIPSLVERKTISNQHAHFNTGTHGSVYFARGGVALSWDDQEHLCAAADLQDEEDNRHSCVCR